jgi:hypothetical protein
MPGALVANIVPQCRSSNRKGKWSATDVSCHSPHFVEILDWAIFDGIAFFDPRQANQSNFLLRAKDQNKLNFCCLSYVLQSR